MVAVGVLMPSTTLSSPPRLVRQRDSFRFRSSDGLYRPVVLSSYRRHDFRCHAFVASGGQPLKAAASTLLGRSSDPLQGNPIILKLAPALGVIIFSMWGLRPLVRHSRNILLHTNDNNWKKSGTYYVTTLYIQPLLLGTSALLICRVLDPALLPTKAIQIVKERFPSNIGSLSTVLGFAYCFSSVIQQAEKCFMGSNEPSDATHVCTGPMIWKNMEMGFELAGKAVYFAVWILLCVELLGFSAQKWLTAEGLGISLLTLASKQAFESFLSSAMIHATKSFAVNERIQAKIDSDKVSGTIEHVGQWSTTIRGEHGEAISIPNGKLSVNVVRNHSRKTHCPIKAHLGISHSDADKIKNIIADMRKVLENYPQVENGEVFLDKVNPRNQALMVSVSCILKTSHLKEHLPVKEAILLDLLGVITGHGARLAPEIHKIDTDSE